jgi:hypothetical protein
MDMNGAEMLDLKKSGDVEAPASLSLGSGRQMVPIGDWVVKLVVLSHVPRAFVAREICVSLPTLVVAYPGVIAQNQPLDRRNLTSVEVRREVLQQRHLQLLDGCTFVNTV